MVATRALLCSVGGSRYVLAARLGIDAYETPPNKVCVAYSERKTPVGGQFGWGGTLLKMYQQSPKVGSDGSEIHR